MSLYLINFFKKKKKKKKKKKNQKWEMGIMRMAHIN